MIPDGFGPASETFARQLYQQEMRNMHSKKVIELPLDSIIVGSVETSPLNLGSFIRDPQSAFGTPITDSAAGATAYSCGIKTFNGAIADFYVVVDGKKKPCGTILEAAKLSGMRTGMVVTSKVADATPGSFWAHALHRNMESLISEYMVGMHGIKKMNDVLIGGGLCSFVPGGSVSIFSNLNFSFSVESSRIDSKNLLEYAKNHHNASIYTSISDINSSNMTSRHPVLGLLAAENMEYEIDRHLKNEPSLSEMTSTALKLLAPINEEERTKGFVLVVEGSKIDMAAHKNDGPAHYREIMAFQEAVSVAISFANSNPNTLVVVVSDHETGGLSVGRQLNINVPPDYVWFPDEILRVKHSLSFMVQSATRFLKRRNLKRRPLYKSTRNQGYQEETAWFEESLLEEFIIKDIFVEGLGLDPSDQRLADGALLKLLIDNIENEVIFTGILSQFISKSARISWATSGHSSVDVNLHAYGYASSLLRGFHANNEIGLFLVNLLDLDLDRVTSAIRQR
uniref:Alkaline phosphatase n=1 Tax=Mitosporidium daphniae TaxID=1485682 RepID=A0A098VMY2_9MICR